MNTESHPFLQRYQGYFRNLLRWDELETLWQQLRRAPEHSWYIYAVGESLPESPSSHDALLQFIEEVDQLLRTEHDYDYCGIVYVDDATAPGLIKIYDPNNLGSSCGSGSLPPPLPGWILSQIPPCDLNAQHPLPGNRRRWWQRIMGLSG